MFVPHRQEQKPFLLIDFSDFLQTSVYVKYCSDSELKNIERPELYFTITVFEFLGRYVLGGVFLQLCQLLSLEQHPIMQKPVDPSLFIHRFTDRKLFLLSS